MKKRVITWAILSLPFYIAAYLAFSGMVLGGVLR